MARFDLTDEEWAVIEPLLPKGGHGPKRCDDRRVLNGMFYILRTGAPRRDLPRRYGPYTTVYNRYVRRGRGGIWKSIFDALAKECEDSLISSTAQSLRRTARRPVQKGGSWRKVLDAHAAVAQARSTWL